MKTAVAAARVEIVVCRMVSSTRKRERGDFTGYLDAGSWKREHGPWPEDMNDSLSFEGGGGKEHDGGRRAARKERIVRCHGPGMARQGPFPTAGGE